MTPGFNWTRCYDGGLTMIPNGDVSGPGVIGSFFGTGWLVTILVIGYYLVGFDPNTQFRDANDPGEPMANIDSKISSNGPENPSLCPNPIDEIILALLHRFSSPVRRLGRIFIPSGFFGSRRSVLTSLEKCIFAMCDAQIITGLGIMTSGYVLLLQGSLSAYHWQIIIYLAWFSNLTHQAALLFLRGYLRKHPRERLWRFCLMTILVVMMVVALVPTIFFNWNEPQCIPMKGYFFRSDVSCLNCSSAAYPAAPARCFYDHAITMNLQDNPALCQKSSDGLEDTVTVDLARSSSLQSAIVSIVVLVLSYTLRAIRLFEVLSSILQHRVRSSLARVCRNGVAVVISWELPCRMLGGTLWSLMVLRPVLAFYIFGRLLIDFLFSTFADICWLLISASIGTIRLLRSIGLDDEGEKVWTFGQVMSIFLLLGPILMLAMGLVHPESSSAVYEQCDRLMHESGSTHASGDDHVRGIEMENVSFMTRAPEREAAMPAHFYTTDHLKFTDEINRLFTRDYYNEHVWIVPVVFAMIIVPTQILSLLAIGLIRNHSLANVSLTMNTWFFESPLPRMVDSA
ncbi:hypothetical protein E8E14_000662 [Neopestalotiopsis sp. 37M]|nr:hypothetical protein E8E14_000662 [Neopestalotiopsis sp. 37M]